MPELPSFHYIGLSQLEQITRGSAERKQRYLRQFLQLVPKRVEKVQEAMSQKDRALIRQTLHSMRPQLQFFEVPWVDQPIQEMEFTYETMEWEKMEQLTEKILHQLAEACKEVESLIEAE